MSLRILILTPRIPYPLKDGGSMAMHQCIEQYVANGCEVSVLSMNTYKHWVDETTLPVLYKKLKKFVSITVNTDVQKVDALLNLFTKKSYNISRFISTEYKEALETLLQKNTFDIIHFESIYTSMYLTSARKLSTALCVNRVHNIEYAIWETLAKNEKQVFKRSYLKILTKRLKKFELEQLNQFDLLLPISPTEKNNLIHLDIKTPAHYLPYCIHVNDVQYLPNKPFDLNSIYHIGSMDWQPNMEGVQWFLEQCWEYIHKHLPYLYIYIAGRNMPAHFYNKHIEGLEIVGEIEHAIDFHLEKNICIIPLQSGAGVRIKVLEAMSLGKTIISTSIGCEGIPVTDAVNILIANTPEEFLIAIKFCFSNRTKSAEIGENAKQFIRTHYNQDEIYKSTIHFLEGKIKHG